MVISKLIAEWRERLIGLRAAPAEEPAGARWVWSIRVRILRFLLARYGENGAPESVEEPPPVRWEFCAVDNPVHVPPRRRPELAPLLRDVRRCRELGVWRWRFWP